MAENVSFSPEELQATTSQKTLTNTVREKIIQLLKSGERPCNISRKHNIKQNLVYRLNVERRGFYMKNGRFLKSSQEGIFNVDERKNWLIED